jgi:hypothetical protein
MVNYSNPLTLLILKKKRYIVRPRAREKQEYTFAKQEYPPISPSPAPLTTSFYAPSTRIVASQHFNLNPLTFAPTRTTSSHLASRLTVLFLPSVRQLG